MTSAGSRVHIGARVSALAGPNDVLVSSTLRDLVIGSGLEFDDRGAHELKGVPGEWRLFAVASDDSEKGGGERVGHDPSLSRRSAHWLWRCRRHVCRRLGIITPRSAVDSTVGGSPVHSVPVGHTVSGTDDGCPDTSCRCAGRESSTTVPSVSHVGHTDPWSPPQYQVNRVLSGGGESGTET